MVRAFTGPLVYGILALVKEAMMRIDITDNPYGKNHKKGYLVFNKKEKRRYVIFFDEHSRNAVASVAYARFLLAKKIGRILEGDEQADHIDGDKLNDSEDNIQLLSGMDNIRKYWSSREREHGKSAMARTGCECDACKKYRRDVRMRWYLKNRDKVNEKRRAKRISGKSFNG